MIISNIYMLDINSTINEFVLKFEQFIDRFTSNGTIASLITIVIFVALCIFVGNSANK